jgi:xylulokinase
VTAAAAAALGLPAGALVAPGSGDNQMSALGAGAVGEGAFVASLGTSGTLFGASGAPVVDASGGIAPFCDATGQWLPLLCTMNCTLVTEEARRRACCTLVLPDPVLAGGRRCCAP